MKKQDIILIGGGGHCRSCIDVIETENKYHIFGIVDEEGKLHNEVLGYKVIACDKDLPDLVGKHENFLITIGSMKDLSKRTERFKLLKKLGARFPVVISPLAHIAKNVFINEGTIVMHKALVNSNASVGKNCIINTSALIEHDSTVGEHSHISTGSIVNGTCHIGNRVFAGSNSVVVDNVDICDDVIIGSGSVVRKSIGSAGIYAGNPALKVNYDSSKIKK